MNDGRHRLLLVGYVQSLNLTQEERDHIIALADQVAANTLNAFKWEARDAMEKVFT